MKEIDMGQRRKETVYVMATELHTSHSISGKIFNILWAASPVQIMIDQNQCENISAIWAARQHRIQEVRGELNAGLPSQRQPST